MGKINITEVGAIDAERIGEHRGSGIPVQSLPFETDGYGHQLWASIGTIEGGFYSPRHHHNFDQVRFMLSGSTQFEDWELAEGEVAYFPESVAYGPQKQEHDSQILTVQFSGASGGYYPLPAEVREGNARLRARDPEFGKGGVGKDATGKERDGFEVLWEELTGRAISYASPRYQNFVIMRPHAFDWVTRDGHQVKHLGSFTENTLQIEIVRVTSPTVLTQLVPDQSELWIQYSGSVRIGDTAYRRAAFQFGLNEQESVTVAGDDAGEFLVLRLPRRTQPASALPAD